MSDQKVAELISKSLRHEISPDESAVIENHENNNPETQKFKDISKMIQESVSGDIHLNSPERETKKGLTQEAAARLKNSVAKAVREKASLSQAGLIANDSARVNTLDLPTSQPKSDENSRQQISRFQLIRRLGQGGLGNVWLARDEKLNRNVAIKELRTEALDSPKALQRFHREAEITGQLEHPNVVPLYQFGTNSITGEPFYAMRFVGKRSLADAIVEFHDRVEAGENCHLGLHRLLSVFLDICQAIAYAHSRGVIHRDLKPENVALDNFGQVIVLDWGLAKVMEDSELSMKLSNEFHLGDSTVLAQTMEGDVVGTPLYMAPEQAVGDLDKIDDKTDVYGLGAILFAILTGKAPHEKSAFQNKTEINEILKLIAQAEAPSLKDYHKCAPAELEAICKKAMARKPHLRFQSVQDLAHALETWMAGQSAKKSEYDAIRMEGRELRAEMDSYVKNLERNARFASGLPPIEQLIRVKADEDIAIWRERLASIFRGLLQANPDYQNIVYSRVDGDQFTELVRVERHGGDSSSLRVVPKTRLRTDVASDYMKSLIDQKPEEVLTSLVCDPMCQREKGCIDTVGLLSGVPVYDNETEDVFGVVMINCDIDQLFRRQMARRTSSSELVVACDIFHIMMHTKSGQISDETLTKRVADQAPHFLPAVDHLQTELEFIDSTNSEIYGARLWFIPNQHGIMYLLKR